MGRTISLAGIPRKKAIRITPSNPKYLAGVSNIVLIICKIELPFIEKLVIRYKIKPAGAAIKIALPKTKIVL